uniref:Uncharacterized protein n=1 Tax=Lotus japonicus TaxID=34305 RepID=I3SZR2_LOTJA|nr:unknown [Lotus japonicus]
MVDVYPSVLR